MSRCSCNKDAPMSRSRLGGLDLLHFGPFLGFDLLQAQLMQNLLNLLQLNKICMEHSAKAHFIPEKLTVKT